MAFSLRSLSVCTVCACALTAPFAAADATRQAPAAQAPAPRVAAATATRAPTSAPTVAMVALDRKEQALQESLRTAVRDLGYQQLVRDGRLAVAVVDLGARQLRYASLNGDRMMYAASMPKIAILVSAFAAIENGRLADSPELRDEMTRMIRYSSNSAATSVLRKVGFEQVARTLQSPALQLYDATGPGGLWIGKAYGKKQYWKRDPIASLSHGATARQAARFFALLDRGLLVSPQASSAMKSMLGDPGISHKFVRGLSTVPGARIYRKSGTWRDYHADAALVERSDARYVIVGIVQDADGDRVLQRLAVAVDSLVRADRPATVVATPAR